MERLDKVLAGTGRWSRREVKDLVRQGRVRIDGVTARTAEEKLDPDTAAISVDGQPVETERFTYVMLHKPAGVLSATEDSRQSTVLDLLPFDQCGGKTATRYTYTVLNYPDIPQGVQANLFVCGDQVIAGDITSLGQGGFRRSLQFPEQ